MGIFINSRHPTNEEEYEALVSLLPGYRGPSHISYTDREILQNSDVFTAIMMVASDLAKMDIHVKHDNEHDNNHVVERLLNKKPNNLYNPYMFKLTVFANSLLT